MRAVVVGGTGLVGSALLRTLAQDPAYASIVSLARRAHEAPARVQVHVGFEVPEHVDVAFCALGTTLKTAGSQEAFRAVDHDLVLQFARDCRARGVQGIHVVSAMGADASSRVFYSRVKGEMERDLRALNFPLACVYRPGLLLGERREHRAGERIGAALLRVIGPVVPRRFRGIRAETVARAMAAYAKSDARGWHVQTNEEMETLAAMR